MHEVKVSTITVDTEIMSRPIKEICQIISNTLIHEQTQTLIKTIKLFGMTHRQIMAIVFMPGLKKNIFEHLPFLHVILVIITLQGDFILTKCVIYKGKISGFQDRPKGETRGNSAGGRYLKEFG